MSTAAGLWVGCQVVLALQVRTHLVVAQVNDCILFEKLRHHRTFEVCGRSQVGANIKLLQPMPSSMVCWTLDTFE